MAAVILGAGMSRRFGSPKQLAELGGRTLLEHAVDGARRAGLAPIVTVVPVWLPLPRAGGPEVTWVRNPLPERGISLSIRLGFAALPANAAAAVILLGDQPHVPPAILAAVLGGRGVRPVVASEVGGVLAPPVLIERSHFHLVAPLRGDAGLRGWLAANPALVRAVPVAGHPRSVDTPEDLDRLRDP